MDSIPSVVGELHISQLIFDAGIVVKLVLLLLACMSIISIAIIAFKYWQLKKIQQGNRQFLEFFSESESLSSLYEARDRFRGFPMARIFHRAYRGYRQYDSSAQSGPDNLFVLRSSLNDIERLIKNSIQQEVSALERLLPFLAITASSAPFIGLFGTVWGIMGSFLNIGAKGSSSLAVVAPGIAEALIATAVGLFAAIPAVVFYNILLGRLRLVRREYEDFGAELIHLLTRSTLTENSA